MNKPFQSFSNEHNVRAIQLRDMVYGMLVDELHGDPNAHDLILNATMGVVCGHIMTHVAKDDWPIMLQLVYKILLNNLHGDGHG